MKDYEEKDKGIATYLMTRKDVRFEGTEAVGDLLYFKFSPFDLAQKYADQYQALKAEPVQPKAFADAALIIKNMIWKWRNGKDVNGGNYDGYR